MQGTLSEILQAGICELGLPEKSDEQELLLKFIDLIQKWNKVYNLTAIANSVEMVTLHLLDSLAVLPHLKHGRIIDIGTGAGLPGIPLAIYAPDCEFVLLDSNSKKTRFVQQAIVELKLNNATVIHARVDDYLPEQKFNTVITRAFASMSDIKQKTKHLLVAQGELLAMKGQPTREELQEIQDPFEIIPLKVPGIDAERCLIRMQVAEEKVGSWAK